MPSTGAHQRTVSSELLPLFEFSKIINNSVDLEFILATVLRTLMGKMLCARGVLLSREEGSAFRFQLCKGVQYPAGQETLTIRWTGRSVVRLSARASAGWRSVLYGMGIRLLVPVLSRGQLVGILGLGERLSRAPYGRSDIRLLQSLMDLSGSAIEKALMIQQVYDANRSLDRKVQELNTLFDLSKELNTGLDHDRIVRLVSFALMGQVGVREYAVCLKNGDSMEILAARGADARAVASSVASLCDLGGPSLLSALLKERETRNPAGALLKLGFEAVVPMHMQGKTAGLMLVGKKLRGGGYRGADLEFLYALGNLAVTSIENVRLFRQAIEKQKMEDELLIAREIQQGLLPDVLPSIAGFDLAAVNIPSKQVGGDYFDVIRRSEHELVVAIGDVSGKGTPAALLMANIQAALRALAPSTAGLAEITGRINDIAATNTKGGSKFITFFWGVLDTSSHLLRYVNAGHNPPLLLRPDGSIEKLEAGGIILGVFATQTPYEQGEVRLAPGDVLFLYTDGISEAMNAKGEDFTEEHMTEIVRRHRRRTSQEILEEVVKAVQKHASGTEQSDDMTLLVLRAV